MFGVTSPIAQGDQVNLFILRLDHRLDRSLADSVIGLGWCEAQGLLGIDEWEPFKSAIRTAYPDYAEKEDELADAADSVWRFLKTMTVGARVVVPVPGAFLVGRVESDAWYDPEGVRTDYAYRRLCAWEVKMPVLQSFASGVLRRRMKARQTCVDASDLLADVDAALKRTGPAALNVSSLE